MIKAKGATMEKQYEIGNLITELRKEKKLTQSKLAEALGVTDKSVSKWENGKSLPDTKIMPRLCEILGISLEELLNGKLNPITESPVLDDLQRLEHVYKYYSDEHRVNVGISDINLALNLGERVAITGPSGSGKTTLLKMIGGIDRFERGEIFIRKEGISRFDEEDYELYRKDFIAYIFQEYGVFENYSLLDNLILVRLLMGDAYKEAKAKALAMLEKVGFAKFAGKKASKLSGGQKQKLAVARALLKDSPIILGDEITSSLDKKSAKEVLRLLFANASGKLVVLVTHHYEEVEEFCTRKITMADGGIVKDEVLEIVPKQDPRAIRQPSRKLNPLRALGILFRNRVGLGLALLSLCLIPSAAIVGGNYGLDYAYQTTLKEPTTHLLNEDELYVRKKDGFANGELLEIASRFEGTCFAQTHAKTGFSYVADPSVPKGIRYTRALDSVFGFSVPTSLAVTFAEKRLSGENDAYPERISVEDYLAILPALNYFGKKDNKPMPPLKLKYRLGEEEFATNVACVNLLPADETPKIHVRPGRLPDGAEPLSISFADGTEASDFALDASQDGLTAMYVGFPRTYFSHFVGDVTEINLLCPTGKKAEMKRSLASDGYVVISAEDELGGIKGNDVAFTNEALFSLFSVLITIALIPLARRFSSLTLRGQKHEVYLWRRIGFSSEDVEASFLALQMVPMAVLDALCLAGVWFLGLASPALLTLSLIEMGLLTYFLWVGDIKAMRKTMEA